MASPRPTNTHANDQDRISQWQQSVASKSTSVETSVRTIFDSSLVQVLSVINQLQGEITVHRTDASKKADQVDQLNNTIERLQNAFNDLSRDQQTTQSDLKEAKLALQHSQAETCAKISVLNATLDSEKTSHEAAMRDLEMRHAEKFAAERAQNEQDFQDLRRSLEEDLEAQREASAAREADLANQMAQRCEDLAAEHEAKLQQAIADSTARHEEEAARWEREREELRALVQETEASATQQIADIEAVWAKRYADAKGKLERAVQEMRLMKQRTAELRRMELEAMDSQGKSMAQRMEEAMKLIRQAQDATLSERLRFSSANLTDDDSSFLQDKENQNIPSPTAIRATYAGKRLSLPRTSSIPPASSR